MYYRKSDQPNAKLWEANAYGDIANVLKLQNDPEGSVQYHLKCIALFEQLNLPDKLVVRYCNLSGLFGDLQEYNKQEEYAKKAVEISQKTRLPQNLFMSYFMLAHCLTLQEKNTQAKRYIDSAGIYADENSNVDILDSYYLIAAQVFRKLNRFDSAFHYFQKSYNLSEKNNYGYGKAESLFKWVRSFHPPKNTTRMLENYLLNGIKLAEAIGANYNMLDDGYKYMSDVYAVTVVQTGL